MKSLYTITINRNGVAVDSIIVAYAPDLVESDYADKDMWDVTVTHDETLDLEDMVARSIRRSLQEEDDDETIPTYDQADSIANYARRRASGDGETIPSTEQLHLTIAEQAARYWEKRAMQDERRSK